MYTVVFLDHDNIDISAEEFKTLAEAQAATAMDEENNQKAIIIKGTIEEYHT